VLSDSIFDASNALFCLFRDLYPEHAFVKEYVAIDNYNERLKVGLNYWGLPTLLNVALLLK